MANTVVKTDSKPSQVVLYQGLINCTTPLSYFMPSHKLERIKNMLEAMVKAQKDQCPVPARVLAKVLGTINAGFIAAIARNFWNKRIYNGLVKRL